jgi:ribosomal protein L19E
MRKKRLGKDEKREVTPEFVNMSKEILYPQIQGVTITFREKQLSLAQTVLLPIKKSRYSKQEERRRGFTIRRGCVSASATAENTWYKIIRYCRLGS